MCNFLQSPHTKWCRAQYIVRKDDNVVHQAPVVQKLDSAIHQINHHPTDNCQGNQLRYPADSDPVDSDIDLLNNWCQMNLYPVDNAILVSLLLIHLISDLIILQIALSNFINKQGKMFVLQTYLICFKLNVFSFVFQDCIMIVSGLVSQMDPDGMMSDLLGDKVSCSSLQHYS